MPQQDHPGYGLPSKRPPNLDPARIAGAQALSAMTSTLRRTRVITLDLGGLDDVAPDDFEGPTTPDEQEELRLLAELCAVLPELAATVGLPPERFIAAHQLDMQLIKISALTGDLRAQTALGQSCLLSHLTEKNDQVEDAITALVEDPSRSLDERRFLKYDNTFPGYARSWEQERRDARKARKALRKARVDAQLSAIAEEGDARRALAQLAEQDAAPRRAPAGKRPTPRRRRAPSARR